MRVVDARAMKRTLTTVLAALLLTGCAAAGAQIADPRITELQNRVSALETKLDTTTEALEQTTRALVQAIKRTDTNRDDIAAAAQVTAALARDVAAVETDSRDLRRLIVAAGLPHSARPLNQSLVNAATEGSSTTVRWVLNQHSHAPVTVTLPDIEGLTFEPKVLTWQPVPYTGGVPREIPKTVTVTVADDDRAQGHRDVVIVPLVRGWGTEFYGYGMVLHISDDETDG